jgi:hypothetical protein
MYSDLSTTFHCSSLQSTITIRITRKQCLLCCISMQNIFMPSDGQGIYCAMEITENTVICSLTFCSINAYSICDLLCCYYQSILRLKIIFKLSRIVCQAHFQSSSRKTVTHMKSVRCYKQKVFIHYHKKTARIKNTNLTMKRTSFQLGDVLQSQTLKITDFCFQCYKFTL